MQCNARSDKREFIIALGRAEEATIDNDFGTIYRTMAEVVASLSSKEEAKPYSQKISCCNQQRCTKSVIKTLGHRKIKMWPEPLPTIVRRNAQGAPF